MPRTDPPPTARSLASTPARASAGVAPVAPSDAPPEAFGRGESVGRAYDQLRGLIVRGLLAPGSRIIESEISERLGVSRTPVRSALHRLQQEGYVAALERGRERRLIVAPLTHDDARELFHIVGQLEALAARAAAERPPAAREALVAELRRLNAGLAALARAARPEPLRVFDLDMAFHRSYVAAGAGPRLLALHDAIKPQAERYIRLYTNSLTDAVRTSVDEHATIVAALAAGSPEEAQGAVETNWRNAAARLGRVIATLGERGSW